MHADAITLYFDFLDPVSYLLEQELSALEAEGLAAVRRAPFELRPPPAPLVGLDAPDVSARWRAARGAAPEAADRLAPPELVPWSRKAHELHLLAAEKDAGGAVRAAVYEAYMVGGRDIGRVDVLVELAADLGLDRTETKAALDVDRLDAGVAEARAEAETVGVTTPATLVAGARRLEGFHDRTALSTFLRDP